MSKSVLGHLVSRLSNDQENLATETLAYVLNESEAANAAFLKALEAVSFRANGLLRYQTQSKGADGTIPDLIGTDERGNECLLVESKFWAGLTGSQPVDYLRRLPEGSDGLLLFIAPSRRMASLWDELLRRCHADGLSPRVVEGAEEVGRVAEINQHHHKLALLSWDSVLSPIMSHLEMVGDVIAASDVRQLLGMCARMNEEAFFPLQAEELAPSIGLRNVQFFRLVEDVVDRMVKKDIVRKGGLRPGGEEGQYRRYMKIDVFGCSLDFNSIWWSRIAETPLWLVIHGWGDAGSSFDYHPRARQILADMEKATPQSLFYLEKKLLIPIHLPALAEREQVLEAIISQVEAVANRLKMDESAN